ncbi:MAG: Ig-like domain-containing protein [Oscillospiraceae bacterium]|nr:Ig-like domain-containing protein [Oscillospiraceae bacterium]
MKILKLLVIFLIPIFILYQSISVSAENIDTNIGNEVVYATDIDLGDYQKEMYVGDTQLLNCTVLPLDSTEQSIAYESTEESIATVNMLGRITAISEGITYINVYVGNVEKSLMLEIKNYPSNSEPIKETIFATDIDLGDFQNKMYVGTTQLLYCTVLPLNSTEQGILYESNNENVATVNVIGRITANSAGKTTITISVGSIKKTLLLEVKNPPEEENSAVTDIEISNFKDTIAVKEEIDISANVLPKNATDQYIEYISENSKIVTVNSNGHIKGISEGTTNIICKTKEYQKSFKITVKKPTDRININETYILMQVGDNFQLDVTISPKEADQTITFKSTNNEVLTVTKNGFIETIKPGNTSVIVSSWDLSVVVNVIVNPVDDEIIPTNSNDNDVPAIEQNNIINEIKSLDNNGFYSLNGNDLPILTESIFEQLFNTKKTLTIVYDDYSLIIYGENVKNISNSLDTAINFDIKGKSIVFNINNGNPLPGSLRLQLKNSSQYKYIYLYNENTDKYEKLNGVDNDTFIIDYAGKYKISTEKLKTFSINWYIVIIVVIIMMIIFAIYVFLNRKYWFW